MVRIRLAIAAAILAVLMAPVGMAQTGPQGYGGEGERIQSDLQGAQAGGILPFTGLELGLFVAGGALLIAGGAGLYRAGRKRA